ncbi:MAG TPA: dipeptide epimerase [Nitrospiraceae bacterium]|nr:dipeptide epimerase [Nitrospiraceae bacterium]
MNDPSLTVTRIELWPVDIPITDPFVVATGARILAENVFIRITLAGGAQGYGEAAPFPEVGGETRVACVAAVTELATTLIGQSAADNRTLGYRLYAQAASQPSARCGLETALVDAYCHATGQPLWSLWGGADVRMRETDITIPIADLDNTVRLARHWYERGFRLFKMKIGQDVDEDIRRLEAVHRRLPDIAFIGDANQGYSREACVAFVSGVKRFGGDLVLLEQPVVREDLEGLAALRHLTGIPVAADESVRSLEDAKTVLSKQAADYVNIKIMKTGVAAALEIASFARTSGLRLMIGGMVEARIAMGCSFSLVLGCGGFDVLDLDTPLLLAQDPVRGGYRYEGPRLHPWQGAGLDMAVDPPPQATVVE